MKPTYEELKALLPIGIPDSAFGPKLMGLLATLTGVLHVAKREAIQLIKDLYGIDMGVGSVPNVEERVSTALNPVYDRIHKFVERVTTIAQTIRKHGGNVLHFIQQAINCFYSRALPPLISEAMGF